MTFLLLRSQGVKIAKLHLRAGFGQETYLVWKEKMGKLTLLKTFTIRLQCASCSAILSHLTFLGTKTGSKEGRPIPISLFTRDSHLRIANLCLKVFFRFRTESFRLNMHLKKRQPAWLSNFWRHSESALSKCLDSLSLPLTLVCKYFLLH